MRTKDAAWDYRLLIVTDILRICDTTIHASERLDVTMRLRELHEIRYEEETANLKLSGLNPYKEAKNVNISIDNPEEFLNAIKAALADTEARPIKLGKVNLARYTHHRESRSATTQRHFRGPCCRRVRVGGAVRDQPQACQNSDPRLEFYASSARAR
jgi:hypothetical protein